eukprot:COSAG05_NODE_1562_length_4554_cov_110.408305_2_plen_319_part_00
MRSSSHGVHAAPAVLRSLLADRLLARSPRSRQQRRAAGPAAAAHRRHGDGVLRPGQLAPQQPGLGTTRTMRDEFDDDSFWESVDVDAIVASQAQQQQQQPAAPAAPAAAVAGRAAAGGRPAHFVPESVVDTLYAAIPDSIAAELLPHQVEGVRFILRCDGRALLADAMGLGKSLQAIAAAVAYREEWPLLVTCPASLRDNWRQEFRRWLPQAWLSAPAPAPLGRQRKRPTADSSGAVRVIEAVAELPSDVSMLAPVTLVSYDLLAKAAELDAIPPVKVRGVQPVRAGMTKICRLLLTLESLASLFSPNLLVACAGADL